MSPSEAESRFKELKLDGVNSIELNLQWELIEHEGPGIYDEAFLANFRKVIIAAEKEGITVSVNFHSGAPSWTKSGQICDDTLKEHCAAALHHAQRRLKNCAAITGWRQT